MANEDPLVDPDYEPPEEPGEFLKLEVGNNVFRTLSKPIMGWEYWTRENDEAKVTRVKTKEEVPKEHLNPKDNREKAKHFWALKVWNYALEIVQVFSFTQKTIRDAILKLSRDPDWKSPVGTDGYDIVIERVGEGLDTEYSVRPKPKKKLDKFILEVIDLTPCDLELLYVGKYPISDAGDSETTEDVLGSDEPPF